MIFPALLAKILAGGALAQAATGATVVVVAVTGAGAAGVLPGPVQDRFAAVVEVVTPFEAPRSEVEPGTDEETPAEELPVEETPDGEVPVVDEDPSEVPAEPPAEAPTADEVVAEWMGQEIEGSFGAWVSAARHDPALMAAIEETGHNFGYYVSRRAQERGLTDDDLEAEGVELGEVEGEDDSAEVTPAPADDDPAGSPAPTRGQRSGHGGGNQGHGGGAGSGSGGGNQGHGGGGGNGGGHGGGGNGGGRG